MRACPSSKPTIRPCFSSFLGRREKMWILFGFECIWKDAFKAGTLKTEQQTFYKKAKKRKMKEIRKKVEII